MNEQITSVKSTVANFSHGVSVGGAATGIMGGLSLDRVAIIVGIVVTIAGFIVNFVFRYLERKDKLKAYERLTSVTDTAKI